MESYIEVFIASRYEDQKDFIIALQEFCRVVHRWKYLEEESKKFASDTGEPSCIILYVENSYIPAVAIAKRSDKTFYIANIIPKNTREMSIAEYNQVARDFVYDLRKFAKDNLLNLTVRFTSSEIDLKHIISGKKCREMFERYLNLYPTSYHPSDIKRLDIFICCLSRYARKHIDLGLLCSWLCQEKGWSENDAAWCTDRIDVGLSILNVNRKYC